MQPKNARSGLQDANPILGRCVGEECTTADKASEGRNAMSRGWMLVFAAHEGTPISHPRSSHPTTTGISIRSIRRHQQLPRKLDRSSPLLVISTGIRSHLRQACLGTCSRPAGVCLINNIKPPILTGSSSTTPIHPTRHTPTIFSSPPPQRPVPVRCASSCRTGSSGTTQNISNTTPRISIVVFSTIPA